MSLTLPLRVQARIRAGIVRRRVVQRTVGRPGKRHRVKRRVTVLRPGAVAQFGAKVVLAGQVVNRDGQAIPGLELQVIASDGGGSASQLGPLTTDQQGRFHYTATATQSRTIRFVYPGSPTVLPAEASARLKVPAESSLGVDRTRVLNGQSVRFAGRVRTLPVPSAGKLVELQVLLSGGWQTFRTTNTDAAGRWAIGYRFQRTRGVQRFRFRARLPSEASYQFETGASRTVTVRVRGR